MNQWSLMQRYGSKNRGSGPVCNLRPILYQAVSNFAAIREPDQLTNACAGRFVRRLNRRDPSTMHGIVTTSLCVVRRQC